MKKLILGLGAISALAVPAVVVVSCGNEDTPTITFASNGVSFAITGDKLEITIENNAALNDAQIISLIKTEAAKYPDVKLPSTDDEILALIK